MPGDSYWLEDPIEEYSALTVAQRGQARLRRFRTLATPEVASNLIAAVTQHPTASPDLAVGLAYAGGLPAEDPMFAQVVKEETKFGFGADASLPGEDWLKETTRWNLLRLQGGFDEVQRVGRIQQEASKTGGNYFSWALDDFRGRRLGDEDAMARADSIYNATGGEPYGAFGDAIAARDRGDLWNITDDPNRWTPGSAVSPSGQDALGRIARDASIVATGSEPQRQQLFDYYASQYGERFQLEFLPVPQQAERFASAMRAKFFDAMEGDGEQAKKVGWGDAWVGQQMLGPAVTEQAATQMDRYSLDIQWPWRLPWQGERTPNYSGLSIGRILASTVTEPGTKPFQLYSGALDAGWNVAADPSNLVLGSGGAIQTVIGLTKVVKPALKAPKYLAGAAERAGKFDELTGLRETAKADSGWKAYNQLDGAGRRQADGLANRGLKPGDPKYDLQEIGRAGARDRALRNELVDLQNTPELQLLRTESEKFGANLTPEGRRLTPMGSQYDSAAQKIRWIENRAQAIRGQIDDWATEPLVDEFKKLSKADQDESLKLAGKADIDPKVSPKLAESQKVGRAALKARAQIRRSTDELAALGDTPTLADNIRSETGLIKGNRNDIDPKKLKEFLSGPSAGPLVRELFDAAIAGDAPAIDAIFARSRIPMPRGLREGLLRADDQADVVARMIENIDVVYELGGGPKSIIADLARRVRGEDFRLERIDDLAKNRMNVALDKLGGTAPQSQLRHFASRMTRLMDEQSPFNIDFNQLDEAYGQVTRLTRALHWERGDPKLEAHLRKLNLLNEGNQQAAYKWGADFAEDLVDSLATTKLHPQIKSYIGNVFKEHFENGIYFADNLGNPFDGLAGADATRLMANGKLVKAPSTQLLSEGWNGIMQMPDPTLIRRAGADMDIMGKIFNWVSSKGAKELFADRVWIRATNRVITEAWKPIVLLRPAWPFKVVGEEQIRIVAAGFETAWSHPLTYIAYGMAKRTDNLLSVTGDVITEGVRFKAAGASRLSMQGDAATKGMQRWKIMERPMDNSGNVISAGPEYKLWRDGTAQEMDQLWKSPIVRRLFESDGVTDTSKIDDVIRWLREDTEGQQVVTRLIDQANDDKVAKGLRTENGVREVVESAYARAQMKAGGTFKLVDPDGSWIDDMGERGLAGSYKNPPPRGGYVIESRGVDEILESYKTGKFRGQGVRQYLDTQSLKVLRKNLDEFLATDQGMKMPARVKGLEAPDMRTWNRVVDNMFEWLMSKPTNELSRHPVFYQAYWRKLGEISHLMDEKTLTETLEGARKAADSQGFEVAGRTFGGGAERLFKQGRASAKGKLGGSAGVVSDLKQVDQLAQSYALWQVQDLLFDVSKRSNLAASMSIIFPFMDAWVEVMGTWGKLMYREMGKPLRRLDQATQGARDNDPFDSSSEWTNKGFFYESNGREVFAVPWVDNLYNAIADTEDQTWEFTPSSLSIMDYLPGVGPGVQLVVQPFLPDGSEFDWAREFVQPYGEMSSIQAGLIPTSWQRVFAAFGPTRAAFSDPALEQTYQWALIDTLKALEREDPEGFRKMQMENPQLLLDKGKSQMTRLFLVQALARFAGPTTPAATPQMEDKNGQVWALAQTVDEYYKLLEENQGDKLAATEQWIALFGTNPEALGGYDDDGNFVTPDMGLSSQLTGKSISIEKRGFTADALKWERDNKPLFDQYGPVAYYLNPNAYLDDFRDFAYPAYQRSLAEEALDPLTAEQWLEMSNDTKGKFAYQKFLSDRDNVLDRMLGPEASFSDLTPEVRSKVTTQFEQEARKYKSYLRERFPGFTGDFNSTPKGIPARASLTEQIVDLQQIIATRPDLVETNEGLYAAAQYMEMKRQADKVAEQFGLANIDTAGDADSTSAGGMYAYGARRILREQAAQLIVKYPSFGGMWDDIFGRKLQNDDDMPELTVQQAYQMLGAGE